MTELLPRVPIAAPPASDRRRWPPALHLALASLVAVVALWIGFTALVPSYYVPSMAMSPALERGDHFRLRRSGASGLERGDIVVYRAPPGDAVSKRVTRLVGLPGERVEGVGGRVLVDGRPLVEPYLPEEVRTREFAAVVVPAGSVFLISDNRDNSLDSRFYGPIARDRIVGRVVWVNFPAWIFPVLAAVCGLAVWRSLPPRRRVGYPQP